MDINKIETILKNFSKPIKKTIKSSTTTNENIEKINKWINTLYMMCNNDQINTNENFLSLFCLKNEKK